MPVSAPRGWLIIVCVAAAGLTGCKPETSNRSKSKTIEGIIVRINASTHRVSMQWRDPKDATNLRELEGTITDTTEIWINGQHGKFEDLREGDRLKAVGYQQGEGGAAEIVAEKLMIDRFIQATAPATRPALTIKPPTTAPTTTPPTATSVSRTPKRGNEKATFKLLITELQKRKRQAIAEREELLKAGTPPDDPRILTLDQRINLADQYIAVAEDGAASHGVSPEELVPATEPDQPATGPAPKE